MSDISVRIHLMSKEWRGIQKGEDPKNNSTLSREMRAGWGSFGAEKKISPLAESNPPVHQPFRESS